MLLIKQLKFSTPDLTAFKEWWYTPKPYIDLILTFAKIVLHYHFHILQCVLPQCIYDYHNLLCFLLVIQQTLHQLIRIHVEDLGQNCQQLFYT